MYNRAAGGPLVMSPAWGGGNRLSRPGRPRVEPGWLHTYRTRGATPLLYIDGMSAGKCDKGTLDSQDVLLLNATSESKGRFWEMERATLLCDLAAQQWGGKIKGFIRMEAGFEIIMCSFKDSVDFVQSVRAGPIAPKGQDPESEDRDNRWQVWEWVKYVTARYDGIGGDRVRLDYDNFVTAYAYDLDLFAAGDDLPRLENASAVLLEAARSDVDAMIRLWDPNKTSNENLTNWQGIADMVVERYGKLLNHLASSSVTSVENVLDEMKIALRVFIDSDVRDVEAEIGRCVAQFNPTVGHARNSIAAQAIRDVTGRICETLFFIYDSNRPLSESLERVRGLVQYLDWSAWKRCPECPYDELCFTPIWPLGATGDRESPQCRNASSLVGRMGYWGSELAHGGLEAG